MSAPSVLVFDSGVGGLSVMREIEASLPHLRLSYASDNEAFPYGTKPEQQVIERVCAVMRTLLREIAPDVVVIACNTASTVALPALRREFAVPIVGVVPAIKTAASLSVTRVIGLLATPATVTRPYTDQLLRDFAADCFCLRVGSSELVETAERSLRGQTVDRATIARIIAPLFVASPSGGMADVVVLGCTHFPLLLPALREAAPRQVRWVDSGRAIASRVHSLLAEHSRPGPVGAEPPQKTAWFTRSDPVAESLKPFLLGNGFSAVRFVPTNR